MVKKQIVPQKCHMWIEARKRYHLSDAQVQMARELGLNPHKFGKLANEKTGTVEKATVGVYRRVIL
jgi:hypothetical protein